MRISLGPNLEAAREAALVEVDAEAARRRATLGGDTVAHALKRAEAERFLGSVLVGEKDCPMLAAEIGVTAPTLSGVALAVASRAARWTQGLATIEAQRLNAKRVIRAAADQVGVRGALSAYLKGGPE